MTGSSTLSVVSSIDAQRPVRVAAVSGSLQVPSRTRALVDTVVREFANTRTVELTVTDLAEVGHQIAPLTSRRNLPEHIDKHFRAVEQADLLIVGSPIYKASYTGLFKHFFDLFDPLSLNELPVLLTATGGSDRHALALEHQFRPLFGFFNAITLPTAIYAADGDIKDREVVNPALLDRIKRAVSEAQRVVGADLRAQSAVQPYRLAANA